MALFAKNSRDTEQARNAFAVSDVAALDHGERFFQRHALDLDEFILIFRQLGFAQFGRVKEMDEFGGVAGSGINPAKRLATFSNEVGFFLQFTDGTGQWNFTGVECASRNLQQDFSSGGTKLADKQHLLV